VKQIGRIGEHPGRKSGFVRATARNWRVRCLPHLTALPLTLLQMELLLDSPVVDLRTLAEVVQRDTGLATQLLQLANADRHPEEYMLRIEDCLVDLGISWLLAVVRELPVSAQDSY
jgi:HD-like signal output (HDOD) protein